MEGDKIPNFVSKMSIEAKLKELLRNITSAELQLCLNASKEFIKLLKSDAGGELLRQYIHSSATCTELLHAWKLRQGKSGLHSVFKLISEILSHPDGVYRVNYVEGIVVSKALDKFARLIIEEKLDDVYKELKGNDVKLQNAALLLLCAIVRRGSILAYDVAKFFKDKDKRIIFNKLAEYRKRESGMKRKFVTRKSFVSFAMSFLEVGKPGLLEGVLKQREMYSGVLRGLGSDDEETVVHVLSTLGNKVLTPESLVSPALRSVLFGSVTLDQLIEISGRGNGELATELAQQVLFIACTDPSNGLMPDMKRRPSPLKGNLTRLLGVMKKLKATEIDYQRDLLLTIVNGKPSFGSAYLEEFPYNIEDHASPTWVSAITLAADVVSAVGAGVPFEFLESQPQESTSFSSSDVQSIIKCICPRHFTRLVINKGLLHSNSLIKHGTLRLVFEALKLLDSFMSALTNSSRTSSQIKPKWVSLKKDIEEEVRISLPDPQVLLSLLSSLNSCYKSPESCLKRAADSELVLEHNMNRSKKLKTFNADKETDIVVGGISYSPSISLSGDAEEDMDSISVDELDNEDDFLKVVAKIWGPHHSTTPSMMPNDEHTYLFSKLLDTLKIYYRAAPTVLEGSFDFFKVLPSNTLALPTFLQQSLLSLLIEYIGWSATCDIPVRIRPQMYKHLHPLLDLVMYSPVKDIKDQAYVLAKAAMLSTGAFDHNLREIGTWFLFLPGYSSNNISLEDQWLDMLRNMSSVVVSFLCDAVSTTGNNLFKYWDLLRRHTYHLQGMKDISPDFSPLVLCILEKCLRLLRAESGAFTLPEKTMISLYVSNTLIFLLQTQVESGLLSSVISLVLSERLDGHCSALGTSPDMCEWRPLKNLLIFLKSITDQQTCSSSPLVVKEVMISRGPLANTIDNIKDIAKRGHDSELAGIGAAYSFSVICTKPAEILQHFPSVITLSDNFHGISLPLLLSMFFHERGLLHDISKLWPKMFSAGLERAVIASRSEGVKEENSGDTQLVESHIAFGTLLEQAPFHVLFPALISIEWSQSYNSKLQDLLLAKLSKGTADMCISYIRLVYFWLHQIRSSYTYKPLHDLITISELCFVVLRTMVTHIFSSEQTGFALKFSYAAVARNVPEVAEIMLCHPAVVASLEHPFSSSEEFTDKICGASFEDFLVLARQALHTMDCHVWNLVATTSDLLLTFYNSRGFVSEVDPAYKRIVNAFSSLVKKLLLILKDKFDQWLKTKNLAPLIPILYVLHTLLQFISPFMLLELVHHMFSRIDINDSAVWSCFTKPALCIGLCIAGRAFDLLSVHLQNLYMKKTQFGLWGEETIIDVCLFEKVYFNVVEIALQCELDVADLCLLKAVNVAKKGNLLQDKCLELCLVVSRVVASTPLKYLTHCIHKTNMSKAHFLFTLTEVSPLHMSVFGHLFSEMLNGYMLKEGKKMQTFSYKVSDDDFLILLPTVLSYLNSSFMNPENQYFKTLTDILYIYWKLLSHGFSKWKHYVWRDIFLVEIGEFWPSSLVEFLTFSHDSLLGKAISMVQYYLALSRNSVKSKKRMKLFSSVCPTSGAHDLLDCDVNEIDSYSNNQSANLLTKTVAKIEFCRMLLFPEDDQIHSPSIPGEDGDRGTRVIPSEVGHEKEYISQIQFVDHLVGAWQSLVKKFPSKRNDPEKVGATSNRSLFRLLEVFILRNICQLTSKISKTHMDLDSIPYIEKLVRSSLLHRFEDSEIFTMLQSVLTSASNGRTSHNLVVKLLLAHSQFAPTIAAASPSYENSQFGIVFEPMSSILRSFRNQELIVRENSLQASEMKLLEVLKLLRILFNIKAQQRDFDFEKEIGINCSELLVLLLSSYSATLSEIDLEIYNLMHVIECTIKPGSSFIAEMDYLWGCAAIKVRKEREKEQNVSLQFLNGVEAIDERRRNEFRDNLPVDPKLCANTVLYFPYDRSIGEGASVFNKLPQVNAEHIEGRSLNIDKSQIYDPVFILHFSIHNLSMGYIGPVEFASFGLLAIALVSISSPQNEMRKLGYETLGRFKNELEKSPKRKDVTGLRLLLTYLQNGIQEPWQRIPSITAMFIAEASFILLDSSNKRYGAIRELLVHSSWVNMKCIPMFDNYFWSSSVNYKSDRTWMLRLLSSGLNLEDDAQLYIRNSIPDTLMSFFFSPLSDDETAELIIEFVVKSVKLHKMSHYLVEQCGLISWLSSMISFFSERQTLNPGSLPSTQLTVILQVVNDAISCNYTIEWLNRGALEQLSELSSHLYKLLVVGVNLMKENVSLVSLVLNVLTSVLRISQKREVCQPHFTSSVEGIFQMYEAIHVCSDGRYNLNAEMGLEAVLMNNPPATIIRMSREKLLRFVHWAMSTAIQSDSKRILQREESYDHLIISLEEEKPEESLISKLLQWLTASVIIGLLSEKFKCLDSTLIHQKSSLVTLHALFDQIERGCGENQVAFGSEDILAAAIFHLQQLLGRKCVVIPSVVSALCLLLFSGSFSEYCNSVDHGSHLKSLFRRIRCPHEANPAWRWSSYHQWKDNSSECKEIEKLDENQACRSLLVVISGILGRKSLYPQYLSCQDLESSDLFKWERSMLESE